MIDYVLQVSGQQQLYYVGHSQGTMMGFAGFSSNEALGSKVKRFYALAPVMSVKHIDGALKYLSDFYKELVVSYKHTHKACTPTHTLIDTRHICMRACTYTCRAHVNNSLVQPAFTARGRATALNAGYEANVHTRTRTHMCMHILCYPLYMSISLLHQWFLDIVGDGEFLPEKGLVQRLGELFCHYDVKEACGDVLFLVCGFNSKNLNEVIVYINIIHFYQECRYLLLYSSAHACVNSYLY